MASRDALPLPTSGHVVVDHSVPAPLGDPANPAPGQQSSDRHVVVDGRESLSAAAYPQTASIPFQYHRTQVLPSPSSQPSRARATPLGAGRRDNSAAAIHGDSKWGNATPHPLSASLPASPQQAREGAPGTYGPGENTLISSQIARKPTPTTMAGSTVIDSIGESLRSLRSLTAQFNASATQTRKGESAALTPGNWAAKINASFPPSRHEQSLTAGATEEGEERRHLGSHLPHTPPQTQRLCGDHSDKTTDLNEKIYDLAEKLDHMKKQAAATTEVVMQARLAANPKTSASDLVEEQLLLEAEAAAARATERRRAAQAKAAEEEQARQKYHLELEVARSMHLHDYASTPQGKLSALKAGISHPDAATQVKLTGDGVAVLLKTKQATTLSTDQSGEPDVSRGATHGSVWS